MKIIALLPVKNEAWILKASLSSLSRVADEIIILDDNSTDSYAGILKNFPTVSFVKSTGRKEKFLNMSHRRMELLRLGRRAGGTHFIWLDADEIFSENFFNKAREYIYKLIPGQKIMMRWIFLWKNKDDYRVDGVFKNIYKDFIVCDRQGMEFSNKFLSENRTPGANEKLVVIDEKDGVVLHFQYLDWKKNQLKQARYRCLELIEGARSARRINATYAITVGDNLIRLEKTPDEWIRGLPFDDIHCDNNNGDWYLKEIITFFDEYGIEFFEPLQIWHIKELYDEFIKRIKREPKIKLFPPLLIKINDLKNKIKNNFL